MVSVIQFTFTHKAKGRGAVGFRGGKTTKIDHDSLTPTLLRNWETRHCMFNHVAVLRSKFSYSGAKIWPRNVLILFMNKKVNYFSKRHVFYLKYLSLVM